MKICTTEKNKKILRQTAVVLFWIGLWQFSAVLLDNSLLLPSVSETVKTLGELMRGGEFYLDISWTLLRCLFSMALSFAAGAAAGAAAYRSAFIRNFLTLPVGFFKAVPVMAVVIYVILLADADWVAVAVCFLMCFPVVYTNVLSGLDSLNQDLLELAYIYRFTAFQRIKLIYFPGIMPQVKAAVRLIAGLSWKAVVAAEVLSIPKYSLGYEMLNAKYYLETSVLFSYILTIVVLSLAMEKLIDRVLKRWSFKPYEGSKVLKTVKAAGEETGSMKHAASPADGILAEKNLPRSVEVCGVCKNFSGREVLKDVNMRFRSGEVTSLIGPSGQGKTTLIRIIAGLETADKGYARFVQEFSEDKESKTPEKKNETLEKIRTYGACRREEEVSYLFQEDRLIPWLNVFDNMAVAAAGGADKEHKESGKQGAGGKAAETERNIKDMAEALEISDSLWKLPEELSGGMRHRTALGRTFIKDAEILILDEPFRGLDQKLKERILSRLWRKATEKKTVIMITHSVEDAKALSGRIIDFEEL